MASHLKKRSFTLEGHATSVALEPEFWAILDSFCQLEKITLPKLISQIEHENSNFQPLASKMRIFCLKIMAQKREE